MAGLIKKTVRCEYITLEPKSGGKSYGELIDDQIAEAVVSSERNSDGGYVQEFSLHFEESEWRELCRSFDRLGDYSPNPGKVKK